jgi:hypothetical protein
VQNVVRSLTNHRQNKYARRRLHEQVRTSSSLTSISPQRWSTPTGCSRSHPDGDRIYRARLPPKKGRAEVKRTEMANENEQGLSEFEANFVQTQANLAEQTRDRRVCLFQLP